MNDNPNILVLTGSLGEGHKQAATALTEAARLYRPDVHVEAMDFAEWAFPHLHMVAKYCYLQCVKHFPSLYGYLFRKTRADNAMSHLLKRTSSLSLARLQKLLSQYKPNVVICTFPSAAAAMSALKSHGLTTLPTVTIITDYTDHSYWVHPYTDQYIVGSDHVRKALIQRHVPESQIAVTGIPIRPAYHVMPDRDRLYEEFGLDRSKRTVLIMGGGFGMIGKSLISLLRSEQLPQELQFVVVCGQNQKLQKLLNQELPRFHHHVLVYGYTQHVRELMAVSDLILTKPGGLTTSEAMAAELPMILFHPLPGQEQDNCAYLVHTGAAIQAEDDSQLEARLLDLLHNPGMLREMKLSAKRCKSRSAALHALECAVETSRFPSGQWHSYIQQFT